MFCYLYVMFDRTSLPLYEQEKCFDECEFCGGDGKCNITIDRHDKLTSDKFGWMIENVIIFDTPKESKSGATKYLSAISLIHPSHPDCWILKCERCNKNKDDEWYTVYRYYKSGNCTEFDDLKSLNRWISRKQYDGRSIEDDDFLRKEGE